MSRERLVNLLLLQAASVVPLVAAGLGARTIGIVIAWLATLAQLAIVRFRRDDLATMLAATAIGVVGESLLVRAELFAFTRADALAVPGWLAPSWAMLGVSFAYVLVRLRGRLVASFVVGVFAGAVALQGAIAAGELTAPTSASRFAIAALLLGVLLAAVSAAAARISRSIGVSPPS
jgi:hypothetical protein